MENSIKTEEQNPQVIRWIIPEYEQHERNLYWYVGAISTFAILLTISIYVQNITFIAIILLASFVIIINDGKKPQDVLIELSGEGVTIGRKFFDFDELKDFSVIYKPSQNVSQLYFEFNSVIKQRLSIPLKNQNPLSIRRFLLQYLKEDLERTDPPLSEALGKMLKL